MTTFYALSGILFLTLVGDYCIKLSSLNANGLYSGLFLFGAALYAVPAIGWFFLMRTNSLAAVGVLYSSATIVALAALGVLVFREAFTTKDAIGIALALASVAVMTSD